NVKYGMTECPTIDPGGVLLLACASHELGAMKCNGWYEGEGKVLKAVASNLQHYLMPKDLRKTVCRQEGEYLLRGVSRADEMVKELDEWAESVKEAAKAPESQVALWQMQIAEVTTNGFQHGRVKTKLYPHEALVAGAADPEKGIVQLAALDFGIG